jgi:uncharacterized membrane protein YeaQ/YmgE (transglycosylase-associated protein family)
MIRSILGAIAGYIVFALALFLLFSGLYLAMGPDRAFLPKNYDPTMLWTISSFILGCVAAAIGGYAAALIGRSGAVKIMAGLVVLIGAIVVVMLIRENKPEEVRTGDVPNMEAMMKAREPVWVAVVNPILGVIGVFVGGSLRKKGDSA